MIHRFMELLMNALANPFMSGGFVLMITGGIIAYARNLPGRLWGQLKSQFVVTVEIANNDPLFDWITLWLNDHPYSQRTRNLIATTLRGEYSYSGDGNGAMVSPTKSSDAFDVLQPRLVMTPARGNHLLWYKRRLLWLSRSKGEATPNGGGMEKPGNTVRWGVETYLVRTFGRSQLLARECLMEVMESAAKAQEKKISAFVTVYGGWRRLNTFAPRKLDSVVLPLGFSESILADIKEFIAEAPWYQEMGIPYHRGYLFYGIPGTGKTSLVAALAGELRMNLYILSLGSEEMTDERFACLISEVPARSFMVLEDVDAAFAARKRKSEEANAPSGTGLTLTGVLNALDGFMAKEGSLIFMTTNHLDLLDPALIRPGRVDRKEEFGFATADQAERMFARFFPTACKEEMEMFAEGVGGIGMTMAQIQQYLLDNRKSKGRAIMGMVPWPVPTGHLLHTCQPTVEVNQ